MNIDPFFETNIKTTPEKPTFQSKVGLLGFFLCSFDTTNGLQILFSYPSKLQHDKNEINILKTHCVWKIENVPLRIDLKFSEFVYSAFQLQTTSQEGTTAEDTPIYGIVIKNWKDINPIPMNAFIDFKTTLESNLGSGLELLYKCEELEANPIRKREYKELVKQTAKIDQILKTTWKEFVIRVNQKFETFTPEIIPNQADSSKIPIETSHCAHDLFKQKITMRVLLSETNDQGIMVVLVNQSENLKDVKIQVSKRTEFFSEPIWEQELEEWPFKEDLILEFPRMEMVENYLIIISSKKTTIDIKSLKVGINNV
ncbi:MAG: hypothetical protein JSW11_19325 [Candidatus Heimdallarchaeota archaeon]|nr:MAG: hypothetical protein JSW11_19325 [Candidatus Heimdallarchaeota archaeon]